MAIERVSRLIGCAGLFAILVSGLAIAVVPDEVPEVPVLGHGVPAGVGEAIPGISVTPTTKMVDGQISDWTGQSPMYGGAAIYSHGEYVYQDHLFDAYGGDDGRDAERLALLAPVTENEARAYRLDPAVQYAQDELDVPVVGPFDAKQTYGNLSHQDRADLAEVRVSFDGTNVWLLARTTTMTAANQTAILILADTASGSAKRNVPFGSGLTSERAEFALLLAGDRGWLANLITNSIVELPSGSVATRFAGFDNAVEAKLPDLWTGGTIKLAVAAGILGGYDVNVVGLLANVANVAFRRNEPVRIHWERDQGLALGARTIDPFFASIHPDKLLDGATETWLPGPGYHDRIFLSTGPVVSEGGDQGRFQHYGVLLPTAYLPGTAAPLQFWLHFRGGRAHTVATVVPRTMQQFGEDVGTIVVSPSARGTSTWYVGRGHVDFNEVWADVHSSFTIDPDRVYVTGHSMGGWGTYLLTILYPDRFAAGMPVAGPVTQGGWTGVDFPGCDQFKGDDYTPCYIQANGSNPRVQHTLRLLENLRNVPLAVFQGMIDELVPVGGVTQQVAELVRLGIPHRYYLFPTYEHYSHPIVDEWVEGVSYMQGFVRNPNPRRVSYRRDMSFERSVETVQSGGVTLNFDFDKAYWMSELTPVDMVNGVARFDGESFGIGQISGTLPEAGGPTAPGQTGPYVMTGLAVAGPPSVTGDHFKATISGASKVRVDLERMELDPDFFLAEVTTDGVMTLRIDGGWTSLPTLDPVLPVSLGDGVLDVTLPPGTTTFSVSDLP